MATEKLFMTLIIPLMILMICAQSLVSCSNNADQYSWTVPVQFGVRERCKLSRHLQVETGSYGEEVWRRQYHMETAPGGCVAGRYIERENLKRTKLKNHVSTAVAEDRSCLWSLHAAHQCSSSAVPKQNTDRVYCIRFKGVAALECNEEWEARSCWNQNI